MATLFSDSFTRSNTSVSAGSTWGNGWTTPVYNNAGCYISSNTGAITHTTLNDAYAYGRAPVADLADATISCTTTTLNANNAHDMLLRSTHSGRLRTQHSGYAFGAYVLNSVCYFGLYRITNGAFTALASTEKPVLSSRYLRFTANGSNLTGETNDATLAMTDSVYQSGWVGFRGYKNSTAAILIDNFIVETVVAQGRPPIYHLVQGGCL